MNSKWRNSRLSPWLLSLAIASVAIAQEDEPPSGSSSDAVGLSGNSLPGPIADIVDTNDFNLTLLPAFTLDVDDGDHFVNLSEAPAASTGITVGPSRLTPNSGTAGYRYIQRRKLTLGLGPQFNFAWAHVPSVGLSIALVPFFGRTVAMDRFVRSKEAALNLPSVPLPYRASDLAAWHDSDNITFAARGGVLFSIGANYGFNSLARVGVAEGEWILYVEKQSATKAYVKITKKRINSLSLQYSSLITTLSVAHFGESDDNFSYQFDLRQPEAIQAYEHMLQGDLLPAQRAESRGSPAVVHLASQSIVAKGLLRNYSFSLPFAFSAQSVVGQVYAFSDEVLYQDGAHSWVHYGVFARQSGTQGPLSRHLSRTSNFIAYHQVRRDRHGRAQLRYAGRFKWAYARDRVTPRRLDDKLEDLEEITGLENELRVSCQGLDLGYTDIAFAANIPQPAVDYLMAHAGDPELFGHLDDAPLLPHARHAFNRMREALLEMQRTRDSSPRDFVNAFARFGRAMVRDDTTFQAVLYAAQRNPVRMTLVVQGENIAKFTRNIAWRPRAVLP
jgi:hypothetical protein